MAICIVVKNAGPTIEEAGGRIRRHAGGTDWQSMAGGDERVLRGLAVTHARNGAEPCAQAGVKRGHLRILVAGLPGVYLEQQQVLHD